jgi:hypothetical protein
MTDARSKEFLRRIQFCYWLEHSMLYEQLTAYVQFMLQIHKTEREISTLCYKKYKGTQCPVIIYEIIPVNSQII